MIKVVEFLGLKVNNAGAGVKPKATDPEGLDNLDYLYNVNLRRSAEGWREGRGSKNTLCICTFCNLCIDLYGPLYYPFNHSHPLNPSFAVTSLYSVIQLTRMALPYLAKSKGNVVTVSSCLSVRQGLANYYSSLKAALDHWNRGMAQTWGPKGVRFNCIKYDT